MTGPYDSVIGVQKEMIIGRFLNNMPARFEAATAMFASAPWSSIAMKRQATPENRKVDDQIALSS